mmetsp:Transcript_5031/g.12945  ORF Transcript_5031/g.12945 Transcript_5031/m.12945 type:complete len:119 (+) Transcript_5031:1-357(+)
MDLVYLISTSLSFTALTSHESSLLDLYHSELQKKLAENSLAHSREAFLKDCAVVTVDYARYLVSAMWDPRSTTRAGIEACAGDGNRGMHRRSVPHFIWMVERAEESLTRWECRARLCS